jgi:AcrR family transcriptional regulator
MKTVSPPEALRERILRAAIESFATHGYEATSVRSVVEAVGCTKPALYYHFGSKPELFQQAVGSVQAEVQKLFRDTLRDAGPVRQRLMRFVDQLMSMVRDDPVPTRLMLTAAHRPERGQPELDLPAMHRDNHELLVQVMAEGMLIGDLRNDLAPTELAHALIGMVHHRALCVLEGEPLPPDISRRIVDLFFSGAQP